MHIGIDARLPYYQMGGISRYILHLLPALADLDTDNNYTVFHSRKDSRSYLPAAENFRGRNLWTPCHHRLERWLLGAELLPRRLDVMHSPDFIPPATGASHRVITVHDLGFLHYPQYLTEESRRYYSEQISWAVKEADQIAVDSEYTRQDLLAQLQVSPQKVHTIHLAASPTFLKSHDPETISRTLKSLNLPSGFILFVGTLEPRKNIPTLLHAYRDLCRASAIDTPLVLVGSHGWLYEEIFETIEQLRLNGRVRHLSRISDEQLAHLYHSAGLLALPSYYEGFGLPPLEAMHCGCPVVVSNRASLPEIVGQDGVTLDADDVESWAATMERVLCDSDYRARLVAAGRQQARRFSWRKTAKATLELYESF
ncbi:MAG TPA: glycosyltransferase family 1 protein [Candidatus Sulfomarinibacteraceae bacterium]|nr:glycosyltransferase family 1 protein [Candidatus Sulfomarinibacteraceae bacterium]